MSFPVLFASLSILTNAAARRKNKNENVFEKGNRRENEYTEDCNEERAIADGSGTVDVFWGCRSPPVVKKCVLKFEFKGHW